MEKKVGESKWVNFVGGGAKGRVWCQIIADVLGREVRQVENPSQAGVRGATMIATVALGIYRDFPTAAKGVKITEVFKPNPRKTRLYDALFVEFKKLYESNKDICEELNASAS
jgi:xylulokinase